MGESEDEYIELNSDVVGVTVTSSVVTLASVSSVVGSSSTVVEYTDETSTGVVDTISSAGVVLEIL